MPTGLEDCGSPEIKRICLMLFANFCIRFGVN